MTIQELNRMKSVDVKTVDKNSLTNICDLPVSSNPDKAKRILHFIENVNNPYCLLINGFAVKFVFADNGCGLEEGVKGYIKGKLGS